MRHFEHRDQIAADLFIGFDHLLHATSAAALGRDHQLVGQEDGEGIVADDRARAPDRMAQPQRHLLAHGDDIARRGAGGFEHREVLAALRHGGFEFEGDVEMLDDRSLAAAGDEDDLLDPRLARLVHRVLDQGTVDDRQQLLGDRLGRGKKPGSETGDGKHRLLDRFTG